MADGVDEVGIYPAAGVTDLVVEGSSQINTVVLTASGGVPIPSGVHVDSSVDRSIITGGISAASGAVSIGSADIVLGAGVATKGSQSYAGKVTVNGNVSLSAGNSPIGFGGPIDGAGTSKATLVVETFGPVGFAGGVGKGVALESLAVIGGGTTRIDGGLVTAGKIALGGVELGADASLIASKSTLVVSGPVESADGVRADLEVSAVGTMTFTGAIGSTRPLGSLTISAASEAAFAGLVRIDGRNAAAQSNGLVLARGVSKVDITSPGSSVIGSRGVGIALGGDNTASTLSGFTISGCTGDGLQLASGSYAGTAISGITSTSNRHGVRVLDGAGDLLIQDSRFSGNFGTGVHVVGTATANVAIRNCLIGVGEGGNTPLGNVNYGLLVSGGRGISIVGSTIGANAMLGIVVMGGANNTVIDDCRIGFGADGTTGNGNGKSGVWVLGGATGTQVTRCLIGWNGYAGVQVSDGCTGTVVGGIGSLGNMISHNYSFGVTFDGTVTGSKAIGNTIRANAVYGMYVNGAKGLAIGAPTAGEGNIIEESLQGVVIGGALADTAISSNTIRKNPSGGIVMLVANGLTVAEGNVISGNTSFGIFAYGDSTGSAIRGSLLSNQAVGIYLCEASNLLIGSPSGADVNSATAGNTITGNTSVGIRIEGSRSASNAILSNAIYGNGSFGLLWDESVPAPPAPVLTSVSTTTVAGVINAPAGTYRIQVFSTAPSQQKTGMAIQGQTLLAVRDWTISAEGLPFTLSDIAGLSSQTWVTATVTWLEGGTARATSTFSAGRYVP